MPTATTIDEYMTRLRDLAGERDHIQRFYLFMTDDELYGLEYELANSDEASAFYDRLLEQYRAWKDEMGSDRWREVLAYNENLNGANRNHLLEDL